MGLGQRGQDDHNVGTLIDASDVNDEVCVGGGEGERERATAGQKAR